MRKKKITAGTKHLAGMYYRITYHSLFHCSVLEPQPKATVEGGVCFGLQLQAGKCLPWRGGKTASRSKKLMHQPRK